MKESTMINLAVGGLTRCLLGASLILAVCHSARAYERYNDPDGGCVTCHGAFDGPTSTKVPASVFPEDSKHVMHGREGTYMNTDCDLCHTSGDGRNPYIGSSDGITGEVVGMGCSGCHVGSALRAHHIINNVPDNCYDCHDPETPPAENVNPPYYGTAYTLANNPCNDVQAPNTGENWTIGDFLGLDNDGDNLYDQADFDCGPPYQLVSAVREGNDIRISWETVGGRTDVLQASTNVAGGYTDLSASIAISGVGPVVTNVVDIGEGASAARFYRVRSQP